MANETWNYFYSTVTYAEDNRLQETLLFLKFFLCNYKLFITRLLCFQRAWICRNLILDDIWASFVFSNILSFCMDWSSFVFLIIFCFQWQGLDHLFFSVTFSAFVQFVFTMVFKFSGKEVIHCFEIHSWCFDCVVCVIIFSGLHFKSWGNRFVFRVSTIK